LNIDVLCTVSPRERSASSALARHQLEAKPRRFGKQNRFSIHHADNSARFRQLGFIFNERRSSMVNRRCVTTRARCFQRPGVNPMLNRVRLKVEK
jgi:hypothetical protein